MKLFNDNTKDTEIKTGVVDLYYEDANGEENCVTIYANSLARAVDKVIELMQQTIYHVAVDVNMNNVVRGIYLEYEGKPVDEIVFTGYHVS